MAVMRIVFGVSTLVLMLAVLADLLRLQREIRSFFRYGLILAVLLTLADLASNLSSGGGEYLGYGYWNAPLLFLLAAAIISFVGTFLISSVGAYSCSLIGVPALPLLQRLTRKGQEGQTPLSRPLLAGAVVAALAVAYSVILFKLIPPQVS